MNDEMISTGIYVQAGRRRFHLDDLKERQRYVKDMTPRQKEVFAKFYVRKVLEAKEEMLWFKRMLKK